MKMLKSVLSSGRHNDGFQWILGVIVLLVGLALVLLNRGGLNSSERKPVVAKGEDGTQDFGLNRPMDWGASSGKETQTPNSDSTIVVSNSYQPLGERPSVQDLWIQLCQSPPKFTSDLPVPWVQRLSAHQMETVLENHHFVLPNGEHRRGQRLIREDQTFELRLFALDQEGYPDPLFDLEQGATSPHEDQQTQALFDEWKTQATMQTVLTIKEAHDPVTGESIRLELENDEERSLELTTQKGYFAYCDQNGCDCGDRPIPR